jgi:hypothetical protein
LEHALIVARVAPDIDEEKYMADLKDFDDFPHPVV